MFEKILVPLDGSTQSITALEAVIEIAKKFNSKITLIHVYSMPTILTEPPNYPPSDGAILASHELLHFDRAITEAAMNILARGERKAKSKEMQVEKLLRKGHIVEEILKASEEGEFDLIILGARGLSRIEKILLGSTSEGVVRHALCPVLVIK